jgi:hypothetical protein
MNARTTKAWMWVGIARASVCTALAAALAMGSLVSAGCKGAPGGRVLKTEPIDTGAGSLEAERRRLQGTWELVKLETFPASGPPQVLDAKGRMTFDEYGNVKTEGSAKAGSETTASLLSYTGQVVIDPQKKEWRLVEVERAADSSALPREVAADKVRAYELVGDQLKLSLRDAAGRVTASVTWKRTG